jgi:hypothetical protein
VDFAEGQEAVAVAAIVDERRLKRRFDPGYLGEIDIAFELLVLCRLEIKFLDPASLDDSHPGFSRWRASINMRMVIEITPRASPDSEEPAIRALENGQRRGVGRARLECPG